MDRFLLFSLTFILISLHGICQQSQIDSTVKNLDEIYVPGKIKFLEHMQNNISYPTEWRKENKVGNVYYEIWIDTTGAIRNVEILKSFDHKFNVIVINALDKTAGNWKIREMDGRKVEYRWRDKCYFELR